MADSNLIERLGRAIFEAPFGGPKISKDAPDLAEIRLAVMDAVKAKAHRAGGKWVFQDNFVRIRAVGVSEGEAAGLNSRFWASYFTDELRAGLTRSSYRYPDDLAVEIVTSSEMPGPGQDWLTVETLLREPEPAVAVLPPVARLTVTKGQAEPTEMQLGTKRVNIGRTAHVMLDGGPSRLNDVAFVEDDRIGRGVSRQHAHIEWEAERGEYRLFNDRIYKGAENCGVYLVRAGNGQPIHRGGHGAVLRDGDEIHLGQAVVVFEVL